MKNLFRITSALVLALLVLSCGSTDKNASVPKRKLQLPVVEVPSKTVTAKQSYPASIEGTVNSAIRAKVPGYISEVLVDEGQKVKKGQLLFRLETESLSQEAAAAEANVNAAQVEVNKLKPLVEKGIISEVQLETAKAKLAQAKAGYKGVTANIGYASINSPIDGYVGSIRYRTGTLVSPGDPNPLTVVSATEQVYAYFAMNEVDYLDFLQNAEGKTLEDKINSFPAVEFRMANGQIYPQEGKIETVTGQINPSTGTVSFRAVFSNENRILASGGSGSILVPKTYKNATVVPEAATYERQGRVYVYRLSPDSFALATSIHVVDRVQNLIVLDSGVKAGEKIVVQGVGKLRDSTAIIPTVVDFESVSNSLKPVFK